MRFLLFLALILIPACNEVKTVNSPSSVPIATQNPRLKFSRIEYRVAGNATSAVVRHSNSIDGLTQVITTLPYTVSFETDKSSIFLSIEVTPVSFSFSFYPFLSAQIFANGELFREATTTTFQTISVSGTWRN